MQKKLGFSPMGIKPFRMRQNKGKTFKTRSQIEAEKSKGSANYRYAKKLRSSADWQKTRDWYLRENPLCQWCRSAAADEVHHIKPVAKFPELYLDFDNLFSVCTKHHEMIEVRARQGEDMETEIRKRKGASDDRK